MASTSYTHPTIRYGLVDNIEQLLLLNLKEIYLK